jgi:ATP-binding cassette subfamily B protein
MPVVKVFNQTTESFTRFTNAVRGYTDNTIDWSKKTVHWWGIGIVFMTSGLSIILPFGVWFYLRGVLPISSLILFLFLGVKYLLPMIKLSNFIGFLSMVTEGVEKIDSILETPEIPETNSPKIPKEYHVEFKNVNFSYGETQVLHNINIKFEEGTVNALVGPSGAGKSTIAHLILRFWDVDDGEILIGGVNVKNIPYDKHMDLVSSVFQDVFILSDTVHENIAMGETSTRAQVIAAAKAAQIHDYVMSLPEGYDTMIGEGGVHMSGGEKQRVSVARAILKNSPIIVLDEATAYADAENESRIQRAFGELMQDKTVIIIAHRLSTITNSDQIIVIDEGRIDNTGTHQELLETPLYSNLWNAHMMTHTWYIGKGGYE